MDNFIQYAPLFIRLAALQLLLAAVSAVHVIRHPRCRFGSKALWIIIVCVVQFIGPAAYFVFGRGEEE